MKVGILGNIKRDIVEKIENLGYEVDTITKKDLKEKTYKTDCEILCGSLLFPKIDLKDFKKLKYIFLFSQGIDYMPLEYIEENKIIMTNNKGAYAEPIGEYIVYSLLMMEKMARKNLENQKNKIWAPRSFTGNLYGKQILFLGTGDIALEGAKRLQGFDIKIIGYNTNGRDVKYFDKCVNSEQLDKELEIADYVVMTLPLTDKTKNFLDEYKFNKMKEGVVFVNIARGDVISETALIDNLKNGKIKYAALDVFEKEPLDVKSDLWDMENVYITPHISGTAEDTKNRFMKNAWNNLVNLKEGKKLINIVDLKRKY